MTIYEIPEEPPVGTRLVDVVGDVWTRTSHDRWTTPGAGHCHWHVLLNEFGPVTEAPAPALPAKPGSIIRATGEDDGAPFKDVVLILDYDGFWRGDVNSNLVALIANDDSIDTFTVLATHDPTTQVVVPRAEWEALRSCVKDDGDPVRHANIASTAQRLVYAAEEAER